MGRKKIQISRIGDERNRQVDYFRDYLVDSARFNTSYFCASGYFHEAKVRADEKSLRAVGPVRLRDRAHHI